MFINEKSLQDLLATKKIIERQALAFHMEAQDFIQGVVQKIVDKAPVQYKLVPNLSCLFPSLISDSKTSCLSRLMNVLLDLTAADHVGERQGDIIIEQFDAFLDFAHTNTHFREYDYKTGSLDTLYYEHMSGKDSYNVVWPVIQELLLLAHGQATVERGFSINAEAMVQNLNIEGWKQGE